MKKEIYNVEGIEIEVEHTEKNDIDAERRKMAYAFKMIREQSGMNRKDFSDWKKSSRIWMRAIPKS